VVTIDGPAAAGKSTTAREVAERLDFLYLDTGAMFRAIAVKVVDENVSPEDEVAVSSLVRLTEIDLSTAGEGVRVLLDGIDVTDRLRTPAISELASRLAEQSEVRARLIEIQRRLAEEQSVVAEGRDTGTVVFPDAGVKIYLEASIEERAARRWRELVERGVPATQEQVLKDLERRDRRDRERELAPLLPAKDSLVVDTTKLSIAEQVERVMQAVRDRHPQIGVARPT
jgi:cytidylate kinase